MNYIYGKVFHEKMSPGSMNFFTNLSYVGLGTFIAAIFSFAFNVLSGRLLGPAEYGEFSLIQSIAMFLYIPMLMGSNTSMVKYNSEKKEFKRQQKIISTTYILVFIQLFATILLYKFLEPEILRIFSISSGFFDLSLIFAALFVLYTLTTETLRSLHEMKRYAILQPVFSIILLVSFLYLFHINLRSSKSIIFAMYITYGIISLITLPFILRYIKLNFDKEWIVKLIKYSYYAILAGTFSVLLTNIDKILISRYMQIEYVGIYRAYDYSFTSLIMIFIFVFTSVFFPYASMFEDKHFLLRKINKSVSYLIVIGLPTTIISGLIILKTYGDAYVIDPKLVLLFGLTSILIAIDALYADLMNSIGIKGIKIVSLATIAMTIINILLNLLLIPVIGIEGAIIATMLSHCTAILIIFSKRKYLYEVKIGVEM